ncbi:MAG: glycosyltransferase family 4 protein [Candidatus Eremiobacteraeota bacterium]|nr:glycosyltransferase family 4 protein [Candidatus Eremiobacteraeota bacterium]
MRFLILTQYFPPEIGAPQTRLWAFAKELARRGHTVEVVTAMPNHPVGRVHRAYRRKLYVRENWHGIRVHRTWIYAASGTGVRRMLNYISFAITSIFGLLRARRQDFIFVESPPLFLCIPAYAASLVRGGAVIFNVADLWPDSVRELGVMKEGPVLRVADALERWAYRRARYVNGVTTGISEILLTKKNVDHEKLRFLPNGIDVEQFCPRPRDETLARSLDAHERFVLLYAGTHGVAQGLETLIEAARLLAARPFLFLFVGAGPTKDSLMERARRYSLDNVRFVGPQPIGEMPRYYSIASASIVPLLRRELFKAARPSKIFPSLASGVPVLFCGEGEAAALLTSAGAGLAIPPESPDALAEAAVRLSENPEMAAKMSRCARDLAVSEYSWSAIVARWLADIRLEAAVGA